MTQDELVRRLKARLKSEAECRNRAPDTYGTSNTPATVDPELHELLGQLSEDSEFVEFIRPAPLKLHVLSKAKVQEDDSFWCEGCNPDNCVGCCIPP